jgi:hypothetical protein
MNVVIALVGLAILVGLALLIGFVDTNARNAAWRRIAVARRDIADARRDQEERERVLLRCLEEPRCARCPVDRYLDGGW